MGIVDGNEYLDQKIWSRVEQIGAFDIYQDITEFLLQSNLFNRNVLVAKKPLTDEEYNPLVSVFHSRTESEKVKVKIDGEIKSLPTEELDGCVFYAVAPYLKRYLIQFDQWYYSCGNFLVWGRKNKEPLNRCSILQAIVTERLSRKMVGVQDK